MISLEFTDGRIFRFYPHAIIPDDRCLLDIDRYFLSPSGKLYFRGHTNDYVLVGHGFKKIDLSKPTQEDFYLYDKCVGLTIKK